MSGPRPEPWRVALEGAVAGGTEALLCSEDRDPFALVGAWAGGGALVGSEPVEVATADDDPFEVLGSAAAVELAGEPPERFVGGGWFGYLGYSLAHRVERLDASPPLRERLPAFVLARYDHLLRRDADGQWWFEALATDERREALERRLELLRGRLLDAGSRRDRGASTTGWRTEPTPAGHSRAVQACRERIAAGDLYQANLSLRLRSELRDDAADLFARGVERLRPERAAYLAGSWGAVASLSPELYLERHDDQVRSAPIKGTAARSADPDADALARATLAESTKDRAENVMIVDLVRNDLGRVCVHGSVEVEALAEPRPRAGVWHLESEVVGRLAPDATDSDLLRATFPPGSVTGAPKVAALGVIAELESAARQVFTGAIGFASPTAGLELSVAIRTLETDGQTVWLDVGGGIVADSDPDAEAAEALTKAAPVLEAIGGELAAPPFEVGGQAPHRRAPYPLPRPDPGRGVFETLLWDGERLHAGQAHCDRLCASARELYGLLSLQPARVLAAARAAAGGADRGCRVRIALSPDGHVEAATAELPAPGPIAGLAPVTLPGGLGPHKWADRRLLDALGAETSPAVALLVDLDGLVLEAAWASVFIADEEGALATPPLDGRILPSVSRAQLIERARSLGIEVAERPIELAELESAPEVMVTSALREVCPVEGRAGEVAATLTRPASTPSSVKTPRAEVVTDAE